MGTFQKSLYYEGAEMKSKDEIFDAVLGKEGGYVNHPDDKGGPTKWGITGKVARAHGYQGDIRDLTRGQALEILEADYWYGPRFHKVASLSPEIAAELCDTGVNMGPSVVSRMLQRWLNVFNQKGELYPDIDADGCIGPRTINALRAYLSKRGRDGELVILTALNCAQGDRYLELAEKREANESFVYGWMKERVVV
ncbi:Peptidoglycan domain protein [Escherichia coli D6-113.11]|nr:Peptidoglycan domain protein [Escherichia coli D6-113.11]CDU35685.1 Peptidoglycan domain protein [Escherichia coli D6-113.11]